MLCLRNLDQMNYENTGKFIEYFDEEPSIELEMVSEPDVMP